MNTTPINLNISTPPVDEYEADGYLELYALWKQLSDRLDVGRDLSAEEFSVWENSVKGLLRAREFERFHKPLRPHIPTTKETIQFARKYHLTKILWARQGIEKFMTDTGY